MTKETYKFFLPEGLDPKAKDELFALAEKLGVQFQQVAQKPEAEDEPSPDFPNPPLWSERTSGREVSPIDWIKMHYGQTGENGEWSPNGLTQPQLRLIDETLYYTYMKTIKRHPDQDLKLPSKSDMIDSDAEKIVADRNLNTDNIIRVGRALYARAHRTTRKPQV